MKVRSSTNLHAIAIPTTFALCRKIRSPHRPPTKAEVPECNNDSFGDGHPPSHKRKPTSGIHTMGLEILGALQNDKPPNVG
eukprot:4714986-Amphidinium_carterae.1